MYVHVSGIDCAAHVCVCVLCTSFLACREDILMVVQKAEQNPDECIRPGAPAVSNMGRQCLGQVAFLQGWGAHLLHGNPGAWPQEVIRQHLVLLVCMRSPSLHVSTHTSWSQLRRLARATFQETQEVETGEDGINMDLDVLQQASSAVPTQGD